MSLKRKNTTMTKQGILFHEVEPYTRKAYLVYSGTRSEVVHLVDLEGFEGDPVVCTCESFILGGVKICQHIKSVMLYQNEIRILPNIQRRTNE